MDIKKWRKQFEQSQRKGLRLLLLLLLLQQQQLLRLLCRKQKSANCHWSNPTLRGFTRKRTPHGELHNNHRQARPTTQTYAGWVTFQRAKLSSIRFWVNYLTLHPSLSLSRSEAKTQKRGRKRERERERERKKKRKNNQGEDQQAVNNTDIAYQGII